jgi:CRP-like cAMP-binding protein
MTTICKRMPCPLIWISKSRTFLRFIILRGSCSVFIKDWRGSSTHVATLHSGSSFGELSFADFRSKRAATVVSNDGTCVLVVEQSSKEYVTGVRSTILLDRQKKYSFLKATVRPIVGTRLNQVGFSAAEEHKLADREFRDLAKFAFSKRFRSGDVIAGQGSACASVFFVVSGSVDILVSLQGEQSSRSLSAPLVQNESQPQLNRVAKCNHIQQRVHLKRSLDRDACGYSISSSFHHKLICDVMNHLDDETQEENHFEQEFSFKSHHPESSKFENRDALQSSNKPDDLGSTLFNTKFIPRPPFEQKEVNVSPRVRKVVENSALQRKCSKSFHLKTALAGNVIGKSSI